ncbi:hypothetical protein ACHAWF_014895 [Thalassiosira exigua]
MSEEFDDNGAPVASDDESDGGSSSATRSSAVPRSLRWSQCVRNLTSPLARCVRAWSRHAASRPLAYALLVPALSVTMMLAGYYSGFELVTSEDVRWAPVGSKTAAHGAWVKDAANGFSKNPRQAVVVVHAQGKNILGDDSNLAREGVERVFYAIEAIETSPGYEEVCAEANAFSTFCNFYGVSRFWKNDYGYFVENSGSDRDVVNSLSATKFPSGLEVHRDVVIGNNEFDESDLLEYGESYVLYFLLPGVETTREKVYAFEGEMIATLAKLRDEWEDSDDYFRLDFFAYRSWDDEAVNVISTDLPWLLLAASLLVVLCLLVFNRRDSVLARKTLGLGAVLTVIFSLLFSYGLLFLVGLPFTQMHPFVPFIVLGVGLDDTFIILGSYLRTDPRLPIQERIERTMKDVGSAILVTTLTTVTTFSLGALSSIPTIKYLVAYAAVAVFVDFIFQITFFVALIALDERRIQANRTDCCFRRRASDPIADKDVDCKRQAHVADRVMSRYGKLLLKRPVSVAVILVFVAMFWVFAWSTAQLTQYFDFTEMLSKDGYALGFWNSWNNYYSANGEIIGVYFRDVDFSDSIVRTQMKSYVKELTETPYSSGYPEWFWVEDFERYGTLENSTFEEQLDGFLKNPVFNELYGNDIVRDSGGNMTASRVWIRLVGSLNKQVKEPVQWLNIMEEISSRQEVNQDVDEWKFFSWNYPYLPWDVYRVLPKEFAMSVILGVTAVTVLAALFIPHWSAAIFIGVSMMMLTIEILGFIQLCGIYLNPLTHVVCLMSIGLVSSLCHAQQHLFHNKFTQHFFQSDGGLCDACHFEVSGDCIQ